METAKLESKGGIGVFGGTFNPIHLGHLIIAEKVREDLDLKKIVFIPSCYPPHKRTPEIGALHRYRMVKLAISTNPYFMLSKIELRRKGISYTIDTVRALKRLYSKAKDFYLILGLDAYLEIGTWKDIEKLARLIKFVVVKRNVIPSGTRNPTKSLRGTKCRGNLMKRGIATSSASGELLAMTLKFKNVKFLNLGPIGISSGEIRKRIKKGDSVRYLLPEKVIDYIYQHHLYKKAE